MFFSIAFPLPAIGRYFNFYYNKILDAINFVYRMGEKRTIKFGVLTLYQSL